MDKQYQDAYKNSVVKLHKSRRKDKKDRNDSIDYWGKVGYYLPYAAIGYVIGGIVGFILALYFIYWCFTKIGCFV